MISDTAPKLDIRLRLDALDQIARHRRGKTFPAHEHADFCREAREKHRRLAGRISRPDQRDFLFAAHSRFDGGGPIPNAAPLEIIEAWNRGAPVAGSRRDDNRLRLDAAAIGQTQGKRRACATEPRLPREWPPRRQISAPAHRRGRSAPGRKCRWEIPNNSRCGRWHLPVRQMRWHRTR